MCGIAGIVAAEAARHEARLAAMVSALAHRGPDGRGLHLFGGCGLGHTRLSIVDLETGQQPMRSRDGAAAIVFNGEIYGYRDIRRRLTDYPFRTSSDTEVILALYERHGEALLSRLPGMFAFALWDERRQQLFCARDRFGEKPLYYAFGRNGEFLFASEIKALLASGLVEPVISRAALAHYLARLFVPPCRTIYENVFCLPPAHALTLRNGALSVSRYWSLPPAGARLDPAEAAAEFARRFREAVRRQLVADVPVSAFLSGGLDSTSVVAAAAQIKPDLRTLAFGFAGPRSELPLARAAARAFGTEHVEMLAADQEIGRHLPRMQEVYDEPFADSSNIPTYLLCQHARRYGKVVLTGDGGDELLAGYGYWYGPLWGMEAARRTPRAAALGLRAAARVCAALWPPAARRLRQRALGLAYHRTFATVAEAHRAQQTYFSAGELKELGLPAAEPAAAGAGSNSVDDALRMDLVEYLPGDILVKTDRASMAHGLELRAPFLDVDLASFCIGLPAALKIGARGDKLILRAAFGPLWPAAVRRRGKQGFGAPVREWLRRADVRPLVQAHLAGRTARIYEYLPFDRARPYADRGDYRTWILLVLALWLERHPFPLGAGAEDRPQA